MAKRLAMASVAKQLSRPSDEERTLELRDGRLALGDAITGAGPGVYELAVPAVHARFVELDDEDDDRPTIGVRVRDTAVVRWAAGAAGGIDAGVFGVWDAARPPEGERGGGDSFAGIHQLCGRPAFVGESGDGSIGCVVGYDAAGAIAVIVAGPAVDPEKFGVAEPTAAAEGAYAAAIAAAAKKKQPALVAAAIAWGIERWRVLLAEVAPAAAATLVGLAITTKKVNHRFPWMKQVTDANDYDMSSLQFDLTRALGDAVAAEATSEVTPELVAATGADALREVRTVPALDEALQQALAAVAIALENTVKLLALQRRKTGDGPAVVERVAALPPVSTLAAVIG